MSAQLAETATCWKGNKRPESYMKWRGTAVLQSCASMTPAGWESDPKSLVGFRWYYSLAGAHGQGRRVSNIPSNSLNFLVMLRLLCFASFYHQYRQGRCTTIREKAVLYKCLCYTEKKKVLKFVQISLGLGSLWELKWPYRDKEVFRFLWNEFKVLL